MGCAFFWRRRAAAAGCVLLWTAASGCAGGASSGQETPASGDAETAAADAGSDSGASGHDATGATDAGDPGQDVASLADAPAPAGDAPAEIDAADASQARYQPISPGELAGMLESKDFLLLNVHIPYAGEIPGTDQHIAYTKLAELTSALANDKSTRAVLYCKTGPMSYKAAHDLVELGFWNVFDLTGGMEAWKAAGYPLDE